MLNQIIEKINMLPPLPKSIFEVQKISQDPDSSIKDLTNIIKDDPMLTANILKIANAPIYGFSKQIKSIDQAVALFGKTHINAFVVNYAIKSTLTFDLSAYNISENHFHDVSTKRNVLILKWIKDKKLLDTLATSSFLIDIGCVIISSVLKENKPKLNQFMEELNNNPYERHNIEKEIIGMTSNEVSAEIFDYWKLDDKITLSVKEIHYRNKSTTDSNILLIAKTAIDLLKGINDDTITKANALLTQHDLDIVNFNNAISLIK